MLGKKQNNGSGKATGITLIASNAEITGDIHFSGGLQIEGRVRGNIIVDDQSTGTLTVSDKGSVEGEIRAPHIVINGVVSGNVYSTEHIELAKKATVTGDVYYNTIEMCQGAKVNGSLLYIESVEKKNQLLGKIPPNIEHSKEEDKSSLIVD